MTTKDLFYLVDLYIEFISLFKRRYDFIEIKASDFRKIYGLIYDNDISLRILVSIRELYSGSILLGG
jgi:hypothetical protein